ncbi:MAG: hypothetical protein KF760_08975 [Candidatus Eremiobacteraeota bacterium]|nr:hypothetical protein [Candidatus Eremiobacteraeota bacterium]MCW5869288.1 hypothetical protein [Candidatus Eremiobacteraeota bacterium]
MIETILALFLLSACCLMMVQLFHQAARADRRNQQVQRAILLAEKTFAQVRSWARQPANFDSSWATFNATFSDPEFPGFSVEVASLPGGRSLLSPASRLEAPYGLKSRRLDRLVVPVRVKVLWGAGQRENVTLFTYCAAPEHPLPANPKVTVGSLPSAPLSFQEQAQITARLEDASGQEIPGVTFHWSLIPMTGNGQLRPDLQSRNGRAMTVQNLCYLPTGQAAVIPGETAVAVQCRYRGRILSNFLPDALPDERVRMNP